MSTLKSAPKIAIITRTKNRTVFLERAIRSVLSQTYQDYVHVILNDGGDKKAVESVLRSNPDVKRIVLHNDTSVGLAAALNQAIKASKSEFIVIHDDDDAWHEDRLKIGVMSIEESHASANVVPMEIVVEDVDSDGNLLELQRLSHPESWSGEISLYKQAHKNYLSNGAIMYSRESYEILHGYDESLPTAEDWDFGIRLMMLHDVEQVISDEALVYYHQRPEVMDVELGNSVHAGVRIQERVIMQLRNNYLREDLKKGRLGIGYIMNSTEQDLVNIVRLEGHINSATTSINTEVSRVEQSLSTHVHKSSFYRTLRDYIDRLMAK